MDPSPDERQSNDPPKLGSIEFHSGDTPFGIGSALHRLLDPLRNDPPARAAAEAYLSALLKMPRDAVGVGAPEPRGISGVVCLPGLDEPLSVTPNRAPSSRFAEARSDCLAIQGSEFMHVLEAILGVYTPGVSDPAETPFVIVNWEQVAATAAYLRSLER